MVKPLHVKTGVLICVRRGRMILHTEEETLPSVLAITWVKIRPATFIDILLAWQDPMDQVSAILLTTITIIRKYKHFPLRSKFSPVFERHLIHQTTMGDDEFRSMKRSRFDQIEPDPKRSSRFDRRSRSPSTRHLENRRSRSPISRSRDSAASSSVEVKSPPGQDPATAAGWSCMFSSP